MSTTDMPAIRQPRTPARRMRRTLKVEDGPAGTSGDKSGIRFAVYERRAMRESAPVLGQKKRNRPGLFVTFEGIEGSGKSTQLHRLAEALRREGIPVLTAREPGGTPMGAELRQVLLHFDGRVDPGAELLLMFADRRQHLLDEIEPALARGLVVLCDRYTDASRAYQGAGRRLGEETVDALHRRFCVREPDRTYLFDCPVPIALARLEGRGGKDRIERETLSFHRRVRAAYLQRAEKEPKRFVVIDARQPEKTISEMLRLDFQQLRAGKKATKG